MDTQSDFEREIASRVDKVESALLALSAKVDGLSASGARQAPPRPASTADFAAAHAAQAAARPPVAPGLRRIGAQPTEERGADWWLARAGAGLTVIAVILLYQYAVGHGWITPWVRVLTGALVGAGLMYQGRKLAPSAPDDALPVALRELMMGAALAIWYITAFAASSRYQLIPLSQSRFLFLVLSIAGGALSLKERRSGLALLAVTAGFLGPVILSDWRPSVPAYAMYTAVLGAMAVILYLMRGWQSVLWISFVAISLTLSLPLFDTAPLILTLMGIATAIAFTRAPTLRRELLATGADRYTEPVRSGFATRWLTETGRIFKLFSPAAGSLDSLSLWVLTIAAPLFGLSFLSSAWPRVNGAVWGALAIVVAAGAYRMCKSSDENGEVTHMLGAASLVWVTFGAIEVAQGLLPVTVIDHGTVGLAVFSLISIAAFSVFDGPRFVAALSGARVMAGLAPLYVLFNEADFMNSPLALRQDPIKLLVSVVELVAIAAGAVAWRDMRRRKVGGDAANILVLMSYGALLLVDARVLGAIWAPLVTASFAVAGTAMLIRSRQESSKMLRAVGGATLVLVMFRLFFVDMAGVDTIWRVFLFLGVGALFLFTSRQLQVAKQAPSESS